VLELMGYFAGSQPVLAVPGRGTEMPIWILGSSLFGAQVAAEFGLPFSFASHFAPAQLLPALRIYRERFRPSRQLDHPYVMPALHIIVADTDAEAQFTASSLEQSFVASRTGRPIQLPPPIEGYRDQLSPYEQGILDDVLGMSMVGSPETVNRRLQEFMALTGADEVIVASSAFAHSARLRSYELLAEIGEPPAA
jgi:luciferase family oxidoreductase group 1